MYLISRSAILAEESYLEFLQSSRSVVIKSYNLMAYLLLSSVTVTITRNDIHHSQCQICRREGTQTKRVVGMSY
jgi:hypothetical protein